MIKRRKEQKQQQEGLEKVFYIVNIGRAESDWWQLRIRDTHFVVSAVATKGDVLRCLRTICLRYKTLPRLQRALRGSEQKMGQVTLDKYRAEYKEQGMYNNEEVEGIVEQCRVLYEEKNINKKKGIRLIEKKVSAPILVEKVIEKKVIPSLLPKRKKGKVRKINI
jgi:hypothetical protein